MSQNKPDGARRWLRRKPETMLDYLLIACGAIAFYMLLYKGGYIKGVFEGFVGMLAPFAGGVVIAYVINPIVDWQMKYIFRGNRKLFWLAMVVGYLVTLTLVIGMIYLIVTQAMTSIASFASNLPGYTKNLEAALLALTSWRPELEPYLATAIEYVQDLSIILGDLIKVLMNSIPTIMGYFSDVTSTFVAVFTAIASSIYLLTQKHKLLRQARTLARAFLPRNVAETFLRICHTANRNLSGFFAGKIIDSAIIGLLTFVCMTVFGLSYAPLISIIVGITNIIPVFGPFIGAVPGILILLFLEPIQALWFAILILFIQQLDGNVIGPKILGDSIGISALWVLVSIVVAGDLFGIAGMVVGVPVFATLYGLVKELAEWSLKQKGIDRDGNPLPPPDAQPPQPDAAPAPAAAPAPQPAAPEKPEKPRMTQLKETIRQRVRGKK